ncbi:MAG: hypothetical protein M3072_15665 [Candidatus Dormibacteraeota bacterium]|nr:hypothetical protein [Candidatus Dormibacteraeota bacterium]
MVDSLPVVIPLSCAGILSVEGDREAARGMARALLLQLVTFHSSEDLRVICCVGEGILIR